MSHIKNLPALFKFGLESCSYKNYKHTETASQEAVFFSGKNLIKHTIFIFLLPGQGTIAGKH